MKADFAEICEFRRTNCELSNQTKKWLNLDASIVLTPTKFRKLDDEPKRNFAARDKFRLFVWSNRNEIPFSQGEISSCETNFGLSKILKYYRIQL